jgi:glycosyltransferase involved in cell wall biosynthesis
LKLAVVVQRYHPSITGGAEYHARELVKKLAGAGYDVEVLTSTSESYVTWGNHYAEGEEQIDGVKVRRFRTSKRWVGTGYWQKLCLKLQPCLPSFWGGLFLRAQGPYCPSMLQYIETFQTHYDRFIFFSYLYYPTVRGLPKVRSKAIMIPTVHDEPALKFSLIQETLKSSPSLWANSAPERDLIIEKVGVDPARIEIMGIGVEAPKDIQISFSNYFLYLGRIGRSKHVDQLIDVFRDLPQLKLTLAGGGDDEYRVPDLPNVEVLGYVEEDKKQELIKNCLAMINPSSLESLSLIALEAMVYRKPLIVNAASDVLQFYADHCSTVKSFKSFSELPALLDWVSSNDWQSSANIASLTATANWVNTKYSWDAILARMMEDLQKV